MNDTAPSLDTPCVHPTYVRLLCITLRGAGVDIDELLQRNHLGNWKALVARDALIPHRAVNAIIDSALVATGKPWLGLEFGAGVQISAHGPLGYAAIAGADLRQALQAVADYASIRNAALRFRLQETQQGATFSMTERMDLQGASQFVVSMLFMTILRLMEGVVGHPLQTLKVDLPLSEHEWRDPVAGHFQGTVRYGAERLAFHLDRATLDLPSMTADPQARARACMECEQLKSSASDFTMAQRVQQLLAGREGNYPTLNEAAGFFSISARTLIRRLKDEGTGFQALLDSARQARAIWYLTHTQRTVEDIAALLGYLDTTNFSRTFRRWYGQTPSEVRSGAQGGAH